MLALLHDLAGGALELERGRRELGRGTVPCSMTGDTVAEMLGAVAAPRRLAHASRGGLRGGDDGARMRQRGADRLRAALLRSAAPISSRICSAIASRGLGAGGGPSPAVVSCSTWVRRSPVMVRLCSAALGGLGQQLGLVAHLAFDDLRLGRHQLRSGARAHRRGGASRPSAGSRASSPARDGVELLGLRGDRLPAFLVPLGGRPASLGILLARAGLGHALVANRLAAGCSQPSS